MFGSMSQTPEIDITEFSPTRSKSSIPDEEPSDAEDAFEFAALKIAELIPVEPQKPVAFDDLLTHVQEGLTIVVCNSNEFMTKNTLKGSHLDMLVAGGKDKKIVLVCVGAEQPPLNFVDAVKSSLQIDKHAKVHCYYGDDDTSKIFALRLNSDSIKCKFTLPQPHFTSSIFPYF